jgi:hypothetical protein
MFNMHHEQLSKQSTTDLSNNDKANHFQGDQSLTTITISGWGYVNFSQQILKAILKSNAKLANNREIAIDIMAESQAIQIKQEARYLVCTHSYGLFRFLDFLIHLKKIQDEANQNVSTDTSLHHFNECFTHPFDHFIKQIDYIYIASGFLNLEHHQQAIRQMLKNIEKKRFLDTLKQFYQLCEQPDMLFNEISNDQRQQYTSCQIIHAYERLDLQSQFILEKKLYSELENMLDLKNKEAIYLTLVEKLAPISCYIHGEYDTIVGGKNTNYGGLRDIPAQHLIYPSGHLLF